jgi:hypothetical protein
MGSYAKTPLIFLFYFWRSKADATLRRLLPVHKPLPSSDSYELLYIGQSLEYLVLIIYIMSSSQSRIAELAAAVTEHTQQIDKYLAEKNLPYPSFDIDGPVDLLLPPDLEKSRVVALQASQELNDLLQGPRDLLFNHQVRNHL